MATYLHLMGGFAVLSVLVGFVLPWLISSDVTLFVILGLFGFFVVLPGFCWFYFRRYYDKLYHYLINHYEKKASESIND